MDKKELLKGYIESNVAPILLDFISSETLTDAVVIPANISVKKLCGHYSDTEYLPPKWYTQLCSKENNRILLIDKIDSVEKEEQLKFVEILKYRKVSTFELPEDCVIILTADKVNRDTVSEEILSLVAKI